ncbi:ExeA family protein [Lacipirellula sp.]|uniref:ExeA family protein n=1 Tax=Lacipirellula sp. TaxID=2691419 RepID=UPI003D0BD3B2
MYHAHWGLERSPFAGGDGLPFFEGEGQTEAIARLRYVAEQRRHALLLAGRGVGKTALLRQFAETRRYEGLQTAMMSLAGLSPREFLWQAAAQLALGPKSSDDVVQLFRRITDHGSAVGWGAGAATALLLDDADQAGADVRMQLLRLLSLAGGTTPWLTVVLAATPTGARRMGDELLDALDLRIELEPWSEPEMVGYIQHALLAAGAEQPIFDDEALGALHALSDGVPRKINRLADHALLGAAAEDRDTIDAAMIEAAHDALSWTTTGS